MNLYSFLLVCFLATDVTRTHGFEMVASSRPGSFTAKYDLRMVFDASNEISPSMELESGDNPCWQNMLDDDCSMGTIYSANFVASKWIKSMPCGEGIEVCKIFWNFVSIPHVGAMILTHSVRLDF
jgi:hypothetical protein